METDGKVFAKVINVVNGNEMYLKSVPTLIGRSSTIDGLSSKDSQVGKTIDILYNYCNINEVNEYSVKTKLIVEKCKSIYPAHLIIYFDYNKKEFKIKGISSFYHNDNLMTENSEAAVLSNFDRFGFSCKSCYAPHIFVIQFPKQGNDAGNFTLQDLNHNAIKESKHINKTPDLVLQNKWTSHEKDCLRKYILIFGYGRWKIIKANSGGVLSEKPDLELKVFSNAFTRSIIDLLTNEKSELKKFLINLIDEGPDDPFILSKKDDWGQLIKQRAPAWGKRLQLIYRVCLLVEKFKTERKRNKELKKKIEDLQAEKEKNEKIAIEGESIIDQIERLKNEINKTYDYWDNLLNFLPNHAFYGQRPTVWWTRNHDIDLLRGTYKHGYANYQQMRTDPKLSFSKLEKDSNFQEFPNADTITRRLKKLIQIIIKSENNNGLISFDDCKNTKEPTGFNLEEKKKILEILIDSGVPLNNEGKSDYNALKSIILKYLKLDNTKTAQALERLVQRLRMMSQLVIQLNDKNDDVSIDDNVFEQMDPDDDGFNITPDEADKLNKNMNMIHFMRKNILINNSKMFHKGLQELEEYTKKLPKFPSNWKCATHDLNLLNAVKNFGFNYLESLSKEKDFQFEDFPMRTPELMNRLSFLCEFYRDTLGGGKVKKKKTLMSQDVSQKKKISKVLKNAFKQMHVNYNENGEIIYPIVINSGLRILNLGRVEWERANYHTEKNLFPIGFKSEREHSSMNKLGERIFYTCEIMDGGSKPIFKLTPENDPNNPIIKESCTGCWIVICHKINNLQKVKRTKVTISGTERFGLCDPNVVRLLQGLEGVEKCARYIPKTFEEKPVKEKDRDNLSSNSDVSGKTDKEYISANSNNISDNEDDD